MDGPSSRNVFIQDLWYEVLDCVITLFTSVAMILHPRPHLFPTLYHRTSTVTKETASFLVSPLQLNAVLRLMLYHMVMSIGCKLLILLFF